MPELSIVIPTHRRAAILASSLAALARQDLAPDRFEAIVVADSEDEGSLGEARALEVPFDLSLHSQPRNGAATARNRGASEARAPIILFLDDDMVASPGFVAEHLSRHADRSIDVVLGHFTQATDGLSDPFLASYVRAWWSSRFAERVDVAHRFSFDDLFSGNFSIKRKLFFGVGGFDERFTHEHSGEDYELAIRLLKVGARFSYAPSATAIHKDNPTIERFLHRGFADGQAHAIIARKHPETLVRLPLASALTAKRRVWSHRPTAIRTPMLLLPIAKALKLRRLWRRFLGRAYERVYWSGVLTELGSSAALRRLFQEAELFPSGTREASFDLRAGYAGLVERLSSGPVDSLTVWAGETPICRLAPVAGAEPLRPIHVVEALARHHASSVVRALDSIGWKLDAERSLEALARELSEPARSGVEAAS
jgi:GT2 family glycosyltransferase